MNLSTLFIILLCLFASGEKVCYAGDQVEKNLEQEISNFLVSISKIRAEIESLQTTLESKRESSKVKLNAKVLNQSELEKSISDLKKENEKISSENIILQREILSNGVKIDDLFPCLLYTSPSPRDLSTSRMPSSA